MGQVRSVLGMNIPSKRLCDGYVTELCFRRRLLGNNYSQNHVCQHDANRLIIPFLCDGHVTGESTLMGIPRPDTTQYIGHKRIMTIDRRIPIWPPFGFAKKKKEHSGRPNKVPHALRAASTGQSVLFGSHNMTHHSILKAFSPRPST